MLPMITNKDVSFAEVSMAVDSQLRIIDIGVVCYMKTGKKLLKM